jgi:hypothetical protein
VARCATHRQANRYGPLTVYRITSGRAQPLAGPTVPGGIKVSSIGDAIRPAGSRALPGAVANGRYQRFINMQFDGD